MYYIIIITKLQILVKHQHFKINSIEQQDNYHQKKLLCTNKMSCLGNLFHTWILTEKDHVYI